MTDVTKPEVGSVWDAMHPCALLILLIPHVKLEPIIGEAVQECLESYSWIDPETGEYAHDSVQHEMKLFEQRRNRGN